ncbi:hypothetical protein HC891_19710 [Candidatus Gracilibacteria bacterium]|nr:hypothetical protein [Candidatus Gracilibacteria bacterium]
MVYSASGGQGSPFKERLLARNRVRVIVRCLPGPLLRECLPAIVAYDTLALAYAVLKRRPAIVAGRRAALRELPQLIAQRQQIQSRRSAPIHTLQRWLEPAPKPLTNLANARRLKALLSPGT